MGKSNKKNKQKSKQKNKNTNTNTTNTNSVICESDSDSDSSLETLPFVSICTPTFNRRPFIPFNEIVYCVTRQLCFCRLHIFQHFLLI